MTRRRGRILPPRQRVKLLFSAIQGAACVVYHPLNCKCALLKGFVPVAARGDQALLL